MIQKSTGIVDVPIKSTKEDRLSMHSFEKALSSFIQYTNTPMTIAIQGEWGSGKTSLMNRLSEQLCQSEESEFYSIWLNTWHYSLVENTENTLYDIINTLIDEVILISKKAHPEKLKSFIKDVSEISKNVLKGVSKAAVRTVVPQISDEAMQEFDKAVFTQDEQNFNLNDLRRKLGNLISEIILKNEEKQISKKTFLFFIDDLDRIEPATAVRILELLKNIFDLKHCIFVLAIDYDVVVSGLKPKFGELSEANEREFRSFFDKIIQLPFRMPLQSFVIDEFLKESLLSIDVINEEESRDVAFINTLAEFARASLGSNPRSLKRLANSLSFIHILIHVKNGEKQKITSIEKQINFAVVCIQIAFPTIYNLLAERPDFLSWDKDFALKHRVNESHIKDEASKLQYQLLHKEWQKVILAAGSKSVYLSRHTYNIIQMMDRMHQIALKANYHIGDIISDVFEFSSVTNVKAELKPKFEINPVRVFFSLNNKLEPLLKEKLPNSIDSVSRDGRMIARLPYTFSNKSSKNRISIHLPVKNQSLAVKIAYRTELFSAPDLLEDGLKNLEIRGKTEQFREICSSLIDLDEKYSSIHQISRAFAGLYIKKDKLMLEGAFQTYIDSVDHLYTNNFLELISDFMIELAKFTFVISNGNWDTK